MLGLTGCVLDPERLSIESRGLELGRIITDEPDEVAFEFLALRCTRCEVDVEMHDML